MAPSAIRTTTLRRMSTPQQRLASLQRQFTCTTPARREVRDAYILSGSRTPVGVFNGALSTVSGPLLGSLAIKSALQKSTVPIEKIDHVYMGNVLSANVGQAPARQAAIYADLPSTVEATTINKVCASGLKAVSLAAGQIQLGLSEAQIAGGFESMSQVPYYLPRASQQPAFGDQKLKDGLVNDGLWDVYNQIHMGSCAESTAKKYSITRKQQDDFAIRSYSRAKAAYASNLFTEEIVPVTISSKKGDTVIKEDEQYTKINLSKLPTLKPVFDRSDAGSITAANSSPLSDGASALILGSKSIAQAHGSSSRVLARIISYADASIDPIDFPVAPAKVVPLILSRAGLTAKDISVWEFNEAFAAVIEANAKILGLESANVNPRGGAIALGHALGSSGSRILVTLLHTLEVGQFGVAAICNGGGAATGMVVQRIAHGDL